MIIKVDNQSVEFEVKQLLNSFHISDELEIEMFRSAKDISTIIKNDGEKLCFIEKVDDGFKETISYKKALFKALKSIYPSSNHPWGILTGIRPVKIAQDLIKKNIDYITIKKMLNEIYYISDEKIDLMLRIAKIQSKYLDDIEKSYSIYISIPFCPSRCNYCSFFSCSLDKGQNLIDPYLDSLEKELKFFYSNKVIYDKELLSIYIGGGTPSTLSINQFQRLIKILQTYVPLKNVKEFTFEAGRPDTLDREKLEAIKMSPVTRLSINPQTMNDVTLKKIGRNHTVSDIIECFKISRDIGFDNINMDLILGLEDESIENITKTLSHIKELKPDSLTVHTLAIKKASTLINDSQGALDKLRTYNIEDFMKISADAADYLGMKPYYLYRQKNMLSNLENIGYALEDKISLYNIAIMEEKQTIIAFGSGSVSKFTYPEENRIERVSNIKDVKLYIDNVEQVIAKKNKEVEKWI